MKFNNKENEQLTLADGRVIWLARSSTVVVTVWCFVGNTPYLLLGKRGEGCPDQIGKWNLPCGYLDWNETLTEAAYREVFEETGVNIRDINKHSILLAYIDQPWKVSSNHYSNNPAYKQNISHHYAMIFSADKLPKLSMDYCELDEVSELHWAPMESLNSYDYAFNHKQLISLFLSRVEVRPLFGD